MEPDRFFGLRTQTLSLLVGSGLKRFFSIKVILRAGSGDFEPCIEHWVCTPRFHSTCVYILLMHVINFWLGSAGGHVMLYSFLHTEEKNIMRCISLPHMLQIIP